MKQTLRCPKCNHNRILYIAVVADLGDHSAPRPAKVAFTGGTQILGMTATSSKDTAGELEAGVCKSCGYTEYYVKDPGSIPIDGQYVREVVGPE